MRAKRIAEDPTYLQREAEYEQEIQHLLRNSTEVRGRDVVLTVPIVFHIVHLGGTENITNEQILNQVDLLNEDFAALNADISTVHPAFQDLIGNAEFRFELPTKDPNGNCTNGIDRIYSPETNVGDDGAKLNPWPRDKYLNVWVVNRMRDGVAGYAYYPGTFDDPIGRLRDGIIILNDYIGQIGTGTAFRSTALTHEIGHYLNLPHVWGNNNGVEEGPPAPQYHMVPDCGDDNVEDTPITRGWNQCRPVNEWADCDRLAFTVQYAFDGVTTGSGVNDPTPRNNVTDAEDPEIVRTEVLEVNATGVSGNSIIDGRFAFTGWATGAPDQTTDFNELTGSFDPDTYYTFTFNPAVTDQLSVDSIRFKMSRNATGARTFAVRSSANNYSSNLAISGNGDTLITVETGNVAFYDTDTTLQAMNISVNPPAAGYTNLSGPLTFRIYGWNAEDENGTFEIDDIAVVGVSGAVENVENYMEYSYCSKMFTIGQAERMRAALLATTGERNSLWTENNLRFTGIAEGYRAECAPIADFYVRTVPIGGAQEIPYSPTVCTGTTVQFIDNSVGGIPTSWEWTFQDGQPATSNARNPLISFTSPGWKTVALTVGNANGTDTKTNIYAILIGGESNDIHGLYQEGFEAPGSTWFNMNHHNNVTFWQRTTATSFSGNACMALNSGFRNELDLIDPANENDYDDLISPTFNLSTLQNATFSFRMAYATGASSLPLVTERLEVASSVDCGKTWLVLPNGGIIDDGDLLVNGNNPAFPPPFWALKSFNLPQNRLVPNVRFRFRYISSEFSGNIYIDDINISGAVGLDNLSPEFFMSLYPNPTNDRFSLAVFGMDRFSTDIVITDLRGAVVYTTTHRPAGTTGIEFSGSELGLANGLYMIRATNEAGNSTQKLLIGK